MRPFLGDKGSQLTTICNWKHSGGGGVEVGGGVLEVSGLLRVAPTFIGIIAWRIFHTSPLCPIMLPAIMCPPPLSNLLQWVSEWVIRGFKSTIDSWQFCSPNLLDATSTGMTTKTTTRKSSVALTIKPKIRAVVLRYHMVAPKTFQINICGSYKQMWLTYTTYIIMVSYVAGGFSVFQIPLIALMITMGAGGTSF